MTPPDFDAWLRDASRMRADGEHVVAFGVCVTCHTALAQEAVRRLLREAHARGIEHAADALHGTVREDVFDDLRADAAVVREGSDGR